MQNTQINKTFKKLLIPVLLVAVVLVCVVGVNTLLQRMNSSIEENGKINMQAVTEQVQQTYELQVENYYSRLRMVSSYIAHAEAEPSKGDDFEFLIKRLQEETGSQVLFMKENGMAMTVDKKTSKLDILSTLLRALKSGQNIAKLISYNSGEGMESGFLLASSCEKYEFDGETFTAVGIVINRENIDSALKLYAYGDQGYLFMLDSDGDVIYTNQTDEKLFQNYSLLKHLNKDGAITDEQVESLYRQFQDRSTGVQLFSGDRAFYMGYSPIENNDFTLVCIVRKGAVDNTLMTYQETIMRTMLAMSIFAFLLLAGLFFSFSRLGLANQKAAFERENLKQQEQNVKKLEALNVELKEAQAVTAQALQSAETASRAKTSFLANMSHDIRTPLNAIIGITALIEHDAGNKEKVLEYVRRIGVSSQSLLAIINEVLDMNKIESGMTTLNSVDFSILDFAHDIEIIFRPQMDAKQQEFELVTKNVQHEWVNGDSIRLMQVFSNLLSNAVKYTQEGGKIQLVIEERPTTASSYAKFRFLVKDNGIGMGPEFQEKIFDAFTREESTLTNKIQGTGLGMAIARNLVEIMGGSIAVESVKGQGSCFEILLDMKLTEQGTALAERHRRGEAQAAASLQGIRFLCAEDNALNAEILVELLKIEGAECTVCVDGKELVETFERSKPGDYDMILMDVQMPIMNGYEAAEAIRSSNHELAASIPIVAMTANAFSEDIQASFAAGMNAHVSKPVDMNVLKRAIGNIQSGRGGGTTTLLGF